LCGAVRQSLVDVSPGPSATMTSRLIERIYANPALFELVAAEEVGQRFVDEVESLALDGNAEETDTMMGLMQDLGAGDGYMGLWCDGETRSMMFMDKNVTSCSIRGVVIL
ncbi:MAG: hypothetical protein AAF639_35625, partial [Chloroflexota bacterium]